MIEAFCNKFPTLEHLINILWSESNPDVFHYNLHDVEDDEELKGEEEEIPTETNQENFKVTQELTTDNKNKGDWNTVPGTFDLNKSQSPNRKPSRIYTRQQQFL